MIDNVTDINTNIAVNILLYIKVDNNYYILYRKCYLLFVFFFLFVFISILIPNNLFCFVLFCFFSIFVT